MHRLLVHSAPYEHAVPSAFSCTTTHVPFCTWYPATHAAHAPVALHAVQRASTPAAQQVPKHLEEAHEALVEHAAPTASPEPTSTQVVPDRVYPATQLAHAPVLALHAVQRASTPAAQQLPRQFKEAHEALAEHTDPAGNPQRPPDREYPAVQAVQAPVALQVVHWDNPGEQHRA
jgi:hypothetical protein